MNVQPEEMSPIQLMVYTDKLHKAAFERMLNRDGQYRSQEMVLVYLLAQEKPVSQAEIAKHFCVSPAAVAITLKKMDEQGWIERKPCPGNARRNEVTLSKMAVQMAKEAYLTALKLEDIVFEGITAEEKKAFTETLYKMQANIHRSFPGIIGAELPELKLEQ